MSREPARERHLLPLELPDGFTVVTSERTMPGVRVETVERDPREEGHAAPQPADHERPTVPPRRAAMETLEAAEPWTFLAVAVGLTVVVLLLMALAG